MRRCTAPVLVLILTLGPACSRDRNALPPTVGQTEASSRQEHAHGSPSADTRSGYGEHPAVTGMAEVTVSLDRRQMIGVRTEPLAKRSLAQRIRTVGVVAADERRVRKVQTKVSGWVQELFVNFTGEYVEQGEAILSIYSPDLVSTQQEYLLALRADRGAGSSPPQDGSDDRRQLVQSARNRLLFWDLTPGQLEQLGHSGKPQRAVTLHAPTRGYVTLKPVYAGMYVTPEMELYTVTELGSVWIWADIYEHEIGLVTPGQSATIKISSGGEAPRAGVVSYVNPTLEPVTRTLRVRFDVDNADERLKPGMYATVELEAVLGDVLAVPEDAIIDTGERTITFVAVDAGRFQPREIRLGRKGDGYYEVLNGLGEGEQVVVSAQFLLDSESRLRGAVSGPTHGGH